MITHVDMHTHKKNFLKLAKRSTCKRREEVLLKAGKRWLPFVKT